MTPFIQIEDPDHECRLPGRTVGFGTTWFCETCRRMYRWDECEGHEQKGTVVYHDGHWNATGGLQPSRIMEPSGADGGAVRLPATHVVP